MEPWSRDPKLMALAESLKGKKVLNSVIIETENCACVLELEFEDHTKIEVGVYGNLYDEAYFIFRKPKEGGER